MSKLSTKRASKPVSKKHATKERATRKHPSTSKVATRKHASKETATNKRPRKKHVGPDLRRGVRVADVRKHGKLLGHVGDTAVLLVQVGVLAALLVSPAFKVHVKKK